MVQHSKLGKQIGNVKKLEALVRDDHRVIRFQWRSVHRLLAVSRREVVLSGSEDVGMGIKLERRKFKRAGL